MAKAYIAGLETLVARGGDLKRVASVASFFISRIDTAIDALIAARLQATTDAERAGPPARPDRQGGDRQRQAGLSAVSRSFSAAALAGAGERGAQTQRLLWASTGTKNPAYRDVFYVEELIGPDTVNTIPPATLDAFRDHGRPRASLQENVEAAFDTMEMLAEAGISMKEVTDKLLADGVQLFADAFKKLLNAVEKQRRQRGGGNASIA